VPTAEPIADLSPTEVVSWHMFELSGRFWLPYIRASRLYMYDVSRLARPDA
jgi:hypothetical protein